MSHKNTRNGSHESKSIDDFIKVVGFLFEILFRGLTQLVTKYPLSIYIGFIWVWFISLLSFWDFKHLKIANYFFPKVFSPKLIGIILDHLPYPWTHAVFLVIIPLVIIGFIYGLFVTDSRKEAEMALSHLGLKTAQDKSPQVVKVIDIDLYRKKIIVSSVGIGVDRYQTRKLDLEMAFRSTIESIKPTENKKYIEICTSNKVIPKMLPYQNCLEDLKEKLSFPLGESLGGFLDQSLSSLPHMMIAGASGGGKSNFFKQTIISLIKSTPHLQVYLLDLKQGVETMEFEGLPNVSVAKTENEASILLAKLKKEMSDRFNIIKKAGRTSIDPELDKKDIIVIAVDEASVLYGKTKVSKIKAQNATHARELTDDLAKLGRAAKMHLILATQKVTTETIDTKIQENMGGRICFKANTLQGSMTVLGNKTAYELPDIKGRAIWNNGTTFVEIQTPFISDHVLASEIKKVTEEFKNGTKKLYSQPFTAQAEVEEDKKENPEEK